jgi:hypothetical protein
VLVGIQSGTLQSSFLVIGLHVRLREDFWRAWCSSSVCACVAACGMSERLLQTATEGLVRCCGCHTVNAAEPLACTTTSCPAASPAWCWDFLHFSECVFLNVWAPTARRPRFVADVHRKASGGEYGMVVHAGFGMSMPVHAVQDTGVARQHVVRELPQRGPGLVLA